MTAARNRSDASQEALSFSVESAPPAKTDASAFQFRYAGDEDVCGPPKSICGGRWTPGRSDRFAAAGAGAG
jgi:hypothetical protein